MARRERERCPHVAELAGGLAVRRRSRGRSQANRRRREPGTVDPWLIRTSREHRSRRGTGAQLPGLFDVEETARRVGNYKWAEMKLFEALGGWVATVPELDVKMRLGTHCYHHAWHAELWHKRLPELREMNPDRLTQPANDAMVRFVEALTEPEAADQTIEKLVGVYRVFIPHFIAAYTFHRNNTSEITDAPTIRSLELHPAGRVRRLARRRDDAAVAHRDTRRGRSCGGAPGPAREAHARGRRHRRPRHRHREAT